MKFLSFLKKTIIIACLLFVILIAGAFLCVHSYAQFDKAGQAGYLSGYLQASDIFHSDVTLNTDTIGKLNDLITRLSPNVYGPFLDEWKVIISPTIPEGLVTPEKELYRQILQASNDEDVVALGYSDWHLRLMFLSAQPDPDAACEVFAHELGHYFDYEFGSPSSSEEFASVYTEYKNSFVEAGSFESIDFSTYSQKEFFATVFKEYILFADHLLSNAPDAYNFIDRLYNAVSPKPSASTTVKYDLQSAFFILKDRIAEYK